VARPRLSTVPVLPATPTLPDLIASNANFEIWIAFSKSRVTVSRRDQKMNAPGSPNANTAPNALPRYLQPDDVERVITSCDRASAVGRRNRAILLLLARLGLRAGDIMQLRLSDIDWQGAWIHVCGKGRRVTRLPLTQEVGDAIVAYLQEGRPSAQTDALFVG
jgi:integrase/recombinase XerD